MSMQIVVISSNSIAREGLCRIIADEDFGVVASGADPDAVDWPACPDQVMVILDVGGAQNQLAAVDTTIKSKPSAHCIVLTEQFDMEAMLQCFEKRAHGYLVKDIPCSQLIASLRLAALGERVMPSNLIDVLANQTSRYTAPAEGETAAERANLSRREMDVLCCLMAGYSNKVIARQLELSEATVKVHVKAILRKLKVGNRTQAAMWGTTHRITPTRAVALAA